ncbi:SPW repeat domain-containing protein [Natrinema salifodinae]|uniref:SPW repeat-containing protein n=1 Tax=Natrinema salifodinae TaxID=1202768 RepID=A0A1I0N039_9EURY|nr:SPW repeat protein [Natrinema salifodinae]SEV94392.1 SPW repeat-containing protein [Natrinema salifodinae]
MSNTPTDTDPNRTATADRARNTLNTDVMQWVSALAALVGLYVVASPFIFDATEAAIWNDTLVGTGVFLLAGYNFVRLSRDRLASVGVASLTVLLGLWLLVSPAVIEMGSSTLATGTALSGLVIAALSAYNAYANNRADTPERAATRA